MTIKEEILDLLNNPSLLEGIDDESKDNKQISDVLAQTFRMIPGAEKINFLAESGAYALAKAMERQILTEIRPGQVRIWLVILEIQYGAKFNLPAHIEDKIYDYMDACENAIVEYAESNLGFDAYQVYNRLQNIGIHLAKSHELSKLTVGGLGNDMVMTRDEIHNFCLQGAVKALEERGFKIEHVNHGSAHPVSIIATKDGVTYSIAVVGAILPKTGSLDGWRLSEFDKIKRDATHKNALLGVSIIPTNELYASMGVAIKEGDYQFKVSPLEIIEARKPEAVN